jgi:hypothetical protein
VLPEAEIRFSSAAKNEVSKNGPKGWLNFPDFPFRCHKRATKVKIWAGQVYYLVNS